MKETNLRVKEVLKSLTADVRHLRDAPLEIQSNALARPAVYSKNSWLHWQVRLLTENCYRTILETRTDWLALQIMYVEYDTKKEDGPHMNPQRALLATKVRQLMEDSCWVLSEKVIETKELEMTDMADELIKFYEVLPEGMFRTE